MTTFTDGPAAGTTLSLRRAPLFLRVVRGPGGIDGLDQLDDRPAIDEELFAYRKVEDRGMVHINARDKRGRHCGGFFAMATYQFVDAQPDDSTMRTNMKWAAWAEAEAKKCTQK